MICEDGFAKERWMQGNSDSKIGSYKSKISLIKVLLSQTIVSWTKGLKPMSEINHKHSY